MANERRLFRTMNGGFRMMISIQMCSLAVCSGLQAQSSRYEPDWQTAAGNQQAFEAASVRQSLPDSRRRDNIDLGPMDSFSIAGGIFSTNVSLDS